MKEHRTKKHKRITALITAVFMLLALLVPAVSAAPVSAAADVTITKIQLVTPPNDPSVVISNDDYSYNLEGAELKVTYSNGNTENLYADGNYFDSWDLDLLPDDLEVEFSINMTAAKEGDFDAEILCEQWDDENNPLAVVKTTVALKGISAKSIQSISVQSLPEELMAYAGTNVVLCEGLKVKAVYTDGTSEVITYEYGSFDTPKYDPTAEIRLKEKTIAQGTNTVEIQYGREELDESEEEYIFNSECVTSFQVTGQKIKLPTGIEIAGAPEQENAYIGKNGRYHYSVNGLKVKISYDDGSSEIVKTEGDDNGYFEDAYFSPAYQPKGLECFLDVKFPDSYDIEEEELVIGKNTLDVVYRMYFNSTVVKKYKEELSVMGVAAKTVKNISVVKGPDKQDLLVGLDDEAIYKGVTVKLEYTDGTSDLVICGGTSDFELPKVLGRGNYMYIEKTELKEGQNTITVVYEDAEENQKKANFQVTASTYIAKDETLDTDQKIGSSIGELGQLILNENNELWINADYSKVAYEKKTGIKKAYKRVYIETSGTGVILDSDGKVAGSYPNALDCGSSELLLKNGDLYSTWSNEKIASDVKTWGGAVALKNDGRVQVLYADKETYLSDAADIVDIQYGYMLDTDGNIFSLAYDWDDATDEEIYSVEKVAANVDKIIDYSYYIGKDGKTYCFPDYRTESKVVFNQEAVAYKSFYEESYDEENDDYDYQRYILFVDSSRNIYLYDVEANTTTRLTGEYEAFTNSGYKTTSGKFYDNKGQATTVLKESDNLSLDTNNVLYMKGTKLLDHVTDFYPYSEPVVITREDGTTWLFDIYDTEDRLRLSPPQKLTEELMASLNNTNAVSVSKLTISVPAQTYTGKVLTPAVTVKDGSKTLKNGTDYTVTYSNNVNAGTGKVTITGKGNYVGSATKTFTIAKAKQTITGTSTFNKAYGSKAFSLGAKAKGKLTYKSSNTKVAKVSSAGKVTIKGTGTATITVNAAATANYNKAAAKKVTIKVAPKKMAAPTVKAAKKKMTVSWKKDTKATGYQLTYALNSKFTKSKKSVTISKNKTTKKTISKLKSKKTYYVKTRAYKTVGKTKLYGSYSKVKKIKVK